MCCSIVKLSAAFLALAGTSSASVLVVAPSGAPFTTIQAAVNASVDGDVVLVKQGVYPGGFSIDARSLSVVADPPGNVSVLGTINIANLTSGQSVLLSGFAFRPETGGGLQAHDNAGALRFEALTTLPTAVFDGDAVSLANCGDVAILRCTLVGANSCMFPCEPASGLVVSGSQVALYDSHVEGGHGSDGHYIGSGGSSQPALPGALGCTLAANSSFFASHSTVVGGQGGAGLAGLCFPGPTPGGMGASGGGGLEIGGTSQAWLLDTQPQGGAGGPGGSGASSCGMPSGPAGPTGAGIIGNANALAGSGHTLTCGTRMRESNFLPLTLVGQPGDLVWVLAGPAPGWTLDLPFQGVRLLATPFRRALLGTIPTSGTLQTSLYFGDLGTGIEARTWQLQAVFLDTSGASALGSGAVLTVLDSAF